MTPCFRRILRQPIFGRDPETTPHLLGILRQPFSGQDPEATQVSLGILMQPFGILRQPRPQQEAAGRGYSVYTLDLNEKLERRTGKLDWSDWVLLGH